MIRNYLKVALRTLLRNRGYAGVNIFGLALGIAGATMLMMYVQQELSFDHFHRDADKTYRVVTARNEAETRFVGVNFAPLGKVLAQEMPEISQQVTLYQNRSQINFRLGEQRVTEENWLMADPNFFEFFDFELIAGDPATVLSQPKSIVLSASLAQKYFGEEEPIGKTIYEYDWGEFVVTGVFKDVPENSHLRFDLVVDAQFRNDEDWQEMITSWERLTAFTYIKLEEAHQLAGLKAKMPGLEARYLGEDDEFFDIGFQALKDIHLSSADILLGQDRNNKGDSSYIYIFSSIAIFLLIIAAVNYTNLATSKALFRAKEVGIRKVVGAHKRQLAIQFLSESLLITFLALVLSVGMIDLALPYFNSITGRSFDLRLESMQDFLPIMLGITFSVGLLSGIYPAVFVSRFQPAKILKGNSAQKGRVSLKKALVVLQFSLSIVMIIATLVISGQMRYIQSADPGFQTEGVLVVDINSAFSRRDFKQVKEAFAGIPGVKAAAAASRVPGEWKRINEVDLMLRNAPAGPQPIRTFYMGFDAEVKDVFGFELLHGEYFSGDDRTDSTKVLLNQAAVKALGLEKPVGSLVRLERTAERVLNATVIGVVEDFKYQSLHSTVAPLVIGSWNSGIRVIDYYTLKVETHALSGLISEVTKVHNQFDPATTIEYHFLDEQLAVKYEAEQQAETIFKLGGGLSLLVACLGLIGLASFTVQQRIKELGIRKVLGASHWNIFYLLSSSFVGLILLAFLVSIPVAYWLMDDWLSNFAFRMPLGFWHFGAAGLSVVLVALISVSYLSIRAVVSNPVESLRAE